MQRTASCILAIALCALLAQTAKVDAVGRDEDPVVLLGADLPWLLSVPSQELVAFRWDGAWVQIPVQVDERAWVDYGQVYDSDPVGLTVLGYCDPGTFMGADPDPGFDSNDELVLLAADAGGQISPSAGNPPGTLPGTRIDLLLEDPIDGGQSWAALFRSDGSLDPAAGIDRVSYAFGLSSGDYLSSYNTMTGPNPENSLVTTASYRMHFQDRWIRDEIHIDAGTANGVDILDRHKNLFAPQNCGRSEDTFSAGEGAFFCNIDGPIRAIRSYMGANSGPFTMRTHWFYPERHDVRTDLRVHAITGVMDFYDYSPAATGMTYINDLNTAGANVDGVANETLTAGPLNWEMITGLQGTLTTTSIVTTDIPGFAYTSYWLDDDNSSVTQCTGDADAYGSSGTWITDPIPNTDPYLGVHNLLSVARVEYLEEPGGDVALAQRRHAQATQPLLVQAGQPTSIAFGPRALLRAAHPNPLNPNTVIPYVLPRDGNFDLSVFDLRGRHVRRLASGFGRAGEHEAPWNGTDGSGRSVASGVYVYRLQVGEFTQSRQMVLVK